jgi:hypothetical protein
MSLGSISLPKLTGSETVSDIDQVALSSAYKANAARRPTVHHGTVPEFCCRGVCESLRSRRNPGWDSTREQPRRVAPWPAYDEKEFLK